MASSTLRNTEANSNERKRKGLKFVSRAKKKQFVKQCEAVAQRALEAHKMYHANPEAKILSPGGKWFLYFLHQHALSVASLDNYFTLTDWSCSLNCTSKDCKKKITPAQAATLRAEYLQNITYSEKENYITNHLKHSIDPIANKAVNIPIAGTPVCLNAFAAALGTSRHVIRRCEEAAITGMQFHPTQRKRRKPKEEKILEFFEKYLQEVADCSPTKDCYYLPMFCQWRYDPKSERDKNN